MNKRRVFKMNTVRVLSDCTYMWYFIAEYVFDTDELFEGKNMCIFSSKLYPSIDLAYKALDKWSLKFLIDGDVMYEL
jgi:hypothetical protein